MDSSEDTSDDEYEEYDLVSGSDDDNEVAAILMNNDSNDGFEFFANDSNDTNSHNSRADEPPPITPAINNNLQNDAIHEPVAEAANIEKMVTNDVDLNATQSDDSCTCPICFEPWGNSDTHRLVSLRCGHLFGRSCVERWLRDSKKKCPQCNTSAKMSEIRNIYARTVKTLDTAEKESLKRKLDEEIEMRKRVETQLQSNEIQISILMSENERLKEELMTVQSALKVATSYRNKVNNLAFNNRESTIQRRQEPFVFLEEIEISPTGNCRVLAASETFDLLLITQPSQNKLFPGFGLRKVKPTDFKPREFVYLHKGLIRDIAFHPHDGIFLTAGADKSVKGTSVFNDNQVFNVDLKYDAWSVCWNRKNPELFYIGLKNGQVFEYDRRYTLNHVKTLTSSEASPVVSLQYVDNHFFEGILSTQLSMSTFHLYNPLDNEFDSQEIAIHGSFLSSHYERRSQTVLLSLRPSKETRLTKHMLISLSTQNSSSSTGGERKIVKTKVEKIFQGGPKAVQLTRSKILPHPGDEYSSLVVAGDESSKGTLIWDVSRGERIQSLKSASSVFDYSIMNTSGTSVLTTLTEKSLNVYKWNL
ncbi:E3 ubiquitin-protein ligase RFWD3-like protein [Dinothrombium tinctorium]|uniref:RING-type E3 ubiquitin transferase n=1 Tax=Dinothrombium tinctorium TaxID=1965070 RepID=A0A3S3PMW8_9ACAR|nr:E3 ubiquitin-protein ligase RFWD3-like protein [Dinothrombium tinctorium]